MILRNNGSELYVLGTIWDGDGMYFISQFAMLEKQYSDITIKMHLYGGSVFDGNLMCNALESSKANISIEILGLAASMGAILALSSSDVKMVENGYMMLHAPHSGSYGEAKDHESSASLLRLMEKNFTKKIMARLQITEAEAKKYIEKDTWLDADQCLALGLISEIIPSTVETILPVVEPDVMGETEVYNMFAALLINPAAAGIPENSQLIFNDDMKKLLIQALALTAVTEASSDTAVIEAVQAKFNEVNSAKDNAEAALKTQRDEQIGAMITAASIEVGEVEIYKKIGETSGIEALATVLKSKAAPAAEKAPNVNLLIQGAAAAQVPSAARADWDFKKWQAEDPKGLEKMSEAEPEKFQQLFNAKYK